MTKFRNLTAADLVVIKGHLEDSTLSKEQAQSALADIYQVHARTIRKWAKRLGIKSRKYTRVEGIEVVNAEEVVAFVQKEQYPAKVLVFDIETAPMISHIWSMWNMNVGQNLALLKSDWFMLTWSAKWLFEEAVFTDKLTPEEALAQDDNRIVKSMWQLLNEADVVITHNGNKFDIKKLNTRFLKHGLNPPMPYQSIDTLVHAKRQFAISSNKLDYIGKFLGLGTKVSTGGFELWAGCMRGEQESLDKMEVYNIGDIALLEAVYLAMRSYIKPHPNMGLFITEDVTCCPTCSSEKLLWEGIYSTYANSYAAFRCGNCGSIGRSRNTAIPRSSKTNLTISTP